MAERYGGYIGSREVQGRLGMARTQLNGDMNGQFLKSFCIFLGKNWPVKSIQRRARFFLAIELRRLERWRKWPIPLVTNNYLAAAWVKIQRGWGNIPARRLMVFGGRWPFSDFNPKLINGQEGDAP